MALLSDYTAGSVTVSADSTTVTGTGTAWQTARFQEGDWFIAGGNVGIIASVDSETQITLVDNWAGATLSDASYRLRYMSDGSRSTAQARALIDLLGTHAFFEPDASGDTAGKGAYDDQAQGFSYLDTSVDPAAIYYKASASSGDWAGPFAYAQGEKGDAATVAAGTTTTLVPGENATVANSGTSSAAVFDFGVPKGEKGDIGTINSTKGDYAGATAYLTGDVVLDQGSSWVALQDTTGNAPPTLPTTSNAYWQLIAQKGEDGTGIGDMKASVYDPTSKAADAFDMANMVEATDAKVMTAAERTKLAGIEALADVTDATNVAAAGAVMESDTSVASMSFVGSGSDLSVDPNKLAKRGDVNDAIAARAPKGHIFGLTLSNNATNPTNEIDIAAGEAASDASSPVPVSLSSGITKRLDAAWAVGTGNGGLDTGTVANGTYHLWLIQRSDTGVTDVLFSASATSPTMPTNYDRKRRIGSIIRSAGAILAFKQRGDSFMYRKRIVDFNTTIGLTYVPVTLSVPIGITVEPTIIAITERAGATAKVYLGNADVLAPETVNGTIGNYNMLAWAGAGAQGGPLIVGNHLYTNTSGQIYALADAASTTLQVVTLGYIDHRGRFE